MGEERVGDRGSPPADDAVAPPDEPDGPQEIVAAAEQETEYPPDETDEG